MENSSFSLIYLLTYCIVCENAKIKNDYRPSVTLDYFIIY